MKVVRGLLLSSGLFIYPAFFHYESCMMQKSNIFSSGWSDGTSSQDFLGNI